jgi:predicted GNAT family acetyltransferase
MTAAVRNNREKHRFELDVGDEIAFANYRLTPSTVIITHTETPRALRGRGIGSELVRGTLELIRADGKKVIAGCGFVADYLDQHPEDADLVA